MKEKIKGLLLCLVIAVPAWLLGRKFAVVGGPVISILLGMIVGMFLKNRAPLTPASNSPRKRSSSGRSFCWASA